MVLDIREKKKQHKVNVCFIFTYQLHITPHVSCIMRKQCGLQFGPTQTELYKHRRWLEAGNIRFKKKRNCTIHVVKTNALIRFTDLPFSFHICKTFVFS